MAASALSHRPDKDRVMLLPPTCPICNRQGSAPCDTCRAALRPAPPAPAPLWVDVCIALLAYEGAGRELLARLKYRNARSALGWLAAQLAVAVHGTQVDVVTWVPTTTARRRERGFDQAELLARSLARRLRLPCRGLLRRCDGPPQTGRGLRERQQGPRLELRGPRVPARVLLVDDVVTTGTSVSVAARTLRSGGASRVHVCAGARTSLKRAPEEDETTDV
jgi:ComF family protein